MDDHLMQYLIGKLRERKHQVTGDEYLEVLFGVAYDAGVLDATPRPKTRDAAVLGDYFFSTGMDALQKHVRRIDGLIAQWVGAGRDVDELIYRRDAANGLADGLEQLWHNDVGISLVDVKRTAKAIPGVGVQLFMEYKIYPNGRPGDFPELAFEGGSW